MEKLTKEQIAEQLSGWEIEDEKIEREFQFPDFRDSINFVNKIADLAENANHHPEIEIHFNKVEVELSTHEAAGVTQKDIDLAKGIEKLV